MNKARAFNPFLCAKTDKLKALIAEVQTQLEGYEAYYTTRKRARRPADQVVQPPNYVPFFNRVSGTGGLMFRAW